MPKNYSTSKELKDYHNRFAGERAFIIGNGPSLNDLDLTKLADEYTFGVNSIYYLFDEMGFKPSFYVVEDTLVAEDRADDINQLSGMPKFFGTYLDYCLNDGPEVIWTNVIFDYSEYPGFPHFSRRADHCLWVGGTVSYLCMQLAYFMGFSEVYLIGFDHSYDIPDDAQIDGTVITSASDDPNHFHPAYFGKGKRWHDPRLDRMELAYHKAHQVYTQDHRVIYNATRGGELEIFPRIEYDSIFASAENRNVSPGVELTSPEPSSQEEEIRVSAVVCTYENQSSLVNTLESLLLQSLPPDQYEVVIVDNNSGDQTAAVAACYPEFRYILEKEVGLSHARNRGIREARGDIVAFIDDDAEADPDWLKSLLEIYDRNPKAWAVGGKVVPIWDAPRPEWLTERYHRSLSLVDWGDQIRPLEWPDRIIGTNCSFRKKAFREIGRFDPKLGRMGDLMLGNEDTEIQERIHRLGHQVVYHPGAVVHHHVPASRMTREYFQKRDQGTRYSQHILSLRQEDQDEEHINQVIDHLRQETETAEQKKRYQNSLHQSRQAFAQYHNKHRGERCVIIGNGPSLNEMDLAPLQDEITFGLNRIYLGFDQWDFRPSYYVSVNPLVLEQHAGEILEEIQAPKFVSINGLPFFPEQADDLIYLQSLPEPVFSKDPRQGVWEGYTVTYVALQLAYFMGFDEVILIGVDHSFVTEGPANAEVVSKGADHNHFAKDYFGKGARWHLPDLDHSELAYRLADLVYRRNGRRILDATRNGQLDVFPKVDLQTVLSSRDNKSEGTSAGVSIQTPDEQDPLVIYQMGKVGSSSLYHSLLDHPVPNPIYQVHYLTDSKVESYSERAARPQHIQDSRELLDLLEEQADIQPYYLSLVRDPVSRNLSAFFENLPEYIQREELLALDRGDQLQALKEAFLQAYPHQIPLTWMEDELESFLGVDIFQQDFPVQDGCQIIPSENAHLLILRTEDLNRRAPEALRTFLGIADLTLSDRNQADQKWYSSLYQDFKDWLTLPEAYLEEMYSSRYARHFYTPGEIESFRARWEEPEVLVSALVSTYNDADLLPGCLDNLEQQTIADRLEIIVIDSGSEQNEGEIVREYQERYDNIRYLRTERETLYDAWNRGLFLARGKYLTTANTDDRHRMDALEVMAEALDAHPEVGLVYGDSVITSRADETFADHSGQRCLAWPEYSLRQALMFDIFGPQPMWRRRCHEEAGIFPTTLEICGDYDFFLRAAWQYSARHIPEVIGLYQEREGLERGNESQSKQETFQLLRHYRSRIPIQDIYPYLKDPGSRPEDLGAALLDFGNRLMTGPYPDYQLAQVYFSQAARHLQPNLPAVNNAAVAYYLLGQEQASRQLLTGPANQDYPPARTNLQQLNSPGSPDFTVVSLPGKFDQELPELISAQATRQPLSAQNASQDRKPGFSFCIISGGSRPEKLDRCIASIHKQAVPDYEIILAGIGTEREDLIYLPLPEAAQAGRTSVMRNAAAARSRFEHLVFIDDDIELQPGWYEGLEPHLADSDLLTTRLLNPDGTRHWDWAAIGGPEGHRLLDYNQPDKHLYLTSGLVICRADIWEEHPWNESLGFREDEDVEWSQRVLSAGYKPHSCQASTAVHLDDRYTQEGRVVVRKTPRGTPAGHSTSSTLGFNVVGYLTGRIGLGVHARNVLRTIRDLGYPAAGFDLKLTDGRGGAELGDLQELMVTSPAQFKHGVNLYVVPLPTLEWLPGEVLKHQSVQPRLQAAWSMWELPVIPQPWIPKLQELDLLIAESDFIRHAFDFNLSGVRTTTAHQPLHLPAQIQENRSRFSLPEDGTLFFTGLEPLSDPCRKNPQGAIQAFLTALGGQPDAHLVIKLHHGSQHGQFHPLVRPLVDQCQSHPRVHLLDENLSYRDVLSLYQSCDVIVSLHRSEGLGLVPMEAMSLGKPVIATAWSGNMTYMNYSNACPVRYRLVPVQGSLPQYTRKALGPDAVWADPDLDDAARWMSRLYRDPALRNRIGQAAARDMEAFQDKARKSSFIPEIKALWDHLTKEQSPSLTPQRPSTRPGDNGQPYQSSPSNQTSSHPGDEAQDTLENILNAEDILQALEDHRDHLDQPLLNLVEANAYEAQESGQEELAEGLKDLADYIHGVINT